MSKYKQTIKTKKKKVTGPNIEMHEEGYKK
jgi:hypothetical protein